MLEQRHILIVNDDTRNLAVAQSAVELSFLFRAPGKLFDDVPEAEAPAHRERFPGWVLPIFSVVLLGTLLALYLGQDAQLLTIQYRMTQLKEKRAAQGAQERDLVLEGQRLSSLGRIERIAVGKLGMVLVEQRVALDLPMDATRAAALRRVVAVRPVSEDRFDAVSPH